MLVLTRNVNQSIIIGDNQVKITVLRTNGRQVALGFEAADEVSIHREEIFDRIKQNEKIENEK